MATSRRNITRPGRGAAGGSSFRGEEGMARTEREIEKQRQASEERKNQKQMPFRFFTPDGKTRQIIICDDKPDFFRYEHAMKGSTGKFNLFTGCVKENDNCPVCESLGKESYYAMYLTVIDLTPFKTRDGTTIEFSRKLMVVKPAQQKKIIRLYRKEKTLRGMILDMTRDGEMAASIGNDIEFVDFADEKEMESYTRSWKDRDGKKHTENCDEPFDYDDLFPEQTADELREIVGGKPSPGSRAADREELERPTRRRARGGKDDDADGWQDEEGEDKDWENEEGEDEPRRGRRITPRRARKAEDEEEPAPRRSRRAKEAEEEEPAPRRRGRADSEAEEEDEPRPRRRRPPEAEEEEAPARSRRARPVAEEEEPEGDGPDEEEEAEAPARTPRRGARRGRR